MIIQEMKIHQKLEKILKKELKKIKIQELPNRKKAIHEAIMSLNTGELLLVAGKGHEKTQDYGKKKLFFSDKDVILKIYKIKNKVFIKRFKIKYN